MGGAHASGSVSGLRHGVPGVAGALLVHVNVPGTDGLPYAEIPSESRSCKSSRIRERKKKKKKKKEEDRRIKRVTFPSY